MMASPSDLSLDCKQHQSYSMLLKSFGEQGNSDDHHSHKLVEFLARLEEERLKIDAFKRELPLCMQLLTNAVETYKQQLQSLRATEKPVLEEFIPLKNGNFETPSSSEKVATTINVNMQDNKENWMTSAQLWVQTPQTDNQIGTNQQQIVATKAETKERRGLPELALASSDDKETIASVHVDHVEQGKGESQCTISTNNTTTTPPSNTTTQTQRKARRCWSPDLHRRFVNALQMLGGSQVATPKQIRELMKVDGLTNDEVKSHLQKYRLHTRRPISPSPQASAAAATPQLVVLGGIWVPQEYATAAAAHGGGAPTLYGAHNPSATPHYCSTTQMMAQDFYSSPVASQPPPHHHQHSLHHQLHMFRPMASQVHGSPESRGHGHGGRSESIEDGKSESGSWKADSGGETGGERKGLVVREEGEGEESNGSEITLKF